MSAELTATPRLQQQQKRSLSALLNVAVDHAHLLSYILVAVGLLGLVALPLLERKINFDENALLAGSARPTLRSKSPGAYQAGKALAASLQSSLFSSSFSAAVQHQLKQHLPSVQVYNHTFTVTNWDSHSRAVGSTNVLTCTNVHVVLNAQRGDGKEALLLGTPINHQGFSTDFEQDPSGALLALSLGGALLQHLASAAPWLAKQVVWLLPDASCGLVESVQAWADAYQNPLLGDPSVQHFGRAGVLQQAMLLEFPSGSLNTLQVSLESYEGLLPKLDMFWLFRWYCNHYVRAPLELTHMGWALHSSTWEHITKQVAIVLDPILPGSSRAVHQALQAVQQHILKFTMACQFVWRQARGLPTGAHAPFKGLMVDAATLRILRKDPDGFVVGPAGFTGATGNRRRPVSDSSSARSVQAQQSQQPQYVLGFDDVLTQLADVVELTLRSCSVLIERFHHSLFLYVLTDLDNFVSVERYIGPLVALICVLAVQAAAIRGSPAAAKDSLSMLVRHLGRLMMRGKQRLQWLVDSDISLIRRVYSGPGFLRRLLLLICGMLLKCVRQLLGFILSPLLGLLSSSPAAERLTLISRLKQKLGAIVLRVKQAPCIIVHRQQTWGVIRQGMKQLLLIIMQRVKHKYQACSTFLAPMRQISPVIEEISEEEEPIMLQPMDVLQLPLQKEAEAARTQWVVAVKLVAAVHILAVAAGCALRNAPALLPLLQQSHRAAAWLAAVAQAPEEHVSDLGVGCGLLLALLAAAEGLVSASGSSNISAEKGSDNIAGRSRSVLWRKVLAVEYSAAAAACAAAACLNWALGYILCLGLVPVALGRAPPLQDKAGSGKCTGVRWSLISVLCCSPPSLVLLLAALSGVGAAEWMQWLVGLVLRSSVGAFIVFWAVYVPFWCLTLWSMVTDRREAGS